MKIGALFDWDGVVVDSSMAHKKAWEQLASAESLPLPEDHFKRGFGKKNNTIIPDILGWSKESVEIKRLSDRKEVLYRQVVQDMGIKALPGVLDLLNFFQDQSIPCCVGSSTDRLNIETIMDIIGVRSYFSGIVSAEDVNHGKPDPEVFLIAAERIGRKPECCVVFEDAVYGIEAGKSGGMKVVGVATSHPIEELHQADIAVECLSELEPMELLKLFRP